MIRIYKNLFLTRRFFLAAAGVIFLFIISFPFPFLFLLAQVALLLWVAVWVADIILLFNKTTLISASRIVPKLFSLGDENTISLRIENSSPIRIHVSVVDELPFQFQKRDFKLYLQLNPRDQKNIEYLLRPVTRGEYSFGDINLYASSFLGLAERRFVSKAAAPVPVYPSIIQMKQMELKVFSSLNSFIGIKKIRRIGHSYEFEQIKNYVSGDDFRTVNWKATSRKADLMVNQYEDERSQQVYSIIDKSRSMRMPFNDMSLLDYAINSSLVISNIAIHKHDKAGLITFADKIDTTLKADDSGGQLKKILDSLYRQKEKNMEANYEMLYVTLRNFIRGRSLLLLFTNFESMYSMERVMPILRRINRMHLLVVIFFENTEIVQYSNEPAHTVKDIYLKTIAQKVSSEKNQVVSQLRQYGIQTILTAPEHLSVNTINKYLELKARGFI